MVDTTSPKWSMQRLEIEAAMIFATPHDDAAALRKESRSVFYQTRREGTNKRHSIHRTSKLQEGPAL